MTLLSGGLDGRYSSSLEGHVISFSRKTKTDTFHVDFNFVAHEGGVNAVAWNPEIHSIFATASADKSVKIWEKDFRILTITFTRGQR